MENKANTEQTKEFQAEVKQLLDIVINSVYTDREIFLRELISNASDALERMRYIQITEKDVSNKDLPLEVRISTDKENNTLTITDTGVGMTKDELIKDIGTIAHSGSKAFIRHLVEAEQEKDINLIGQFGIGFYSAFMAASEISLYTRSYKPGSSGWKWTSEGGGSYTINKVDSLQRGTSIVLKLKEDADEFADPENIKNIINKYSSFVPFPILLNGERINTLQAIWTKNKSEIKDEEYTEFYRYIANVNEEPLFKLHFSADAPLAMNAVLFVPQENYEKFGFGRMEPGVNLYSRNVLIHQQSGHILPDWLRFLRGVIESEELPLSISREAMQDSALISKLNRVITRRFLKFLKGEAEKNPANYNEFWKKFNMFIKEGAATDYTHKNEIMELLRFETSKSKELTSLKEYINRMKENQEAIYYLNASNREAAEVSPYLEVFNEKDIEVIFTYETIDDYIFTQLGKYEELSLASADEADLNLESEDEKEGMEEEDIKVLINWLENALGDKVKEVRPSKRLINSPALVVDPSGLSSSMQRVMQAMSQGEEDINSGPKILEINTKHPVIKELNSVRLADQDFAKIAAEQIFDNALISAGLKVDHKSMVNRVYKIMEQALSK